MSLLPSTTIPFHKVLLTYTRPPSASHLNTVEAITFLRFLKIKTPYTLTHYFFYLPLPHGFWVMASFSSPLRMSCTTLGPPETVQSRL